MKGRLTDEGCSKRNAQEKAERAEMLSRTKILERQVRQARMEKLTRKFELEKRRACLN